jgi:DNA invertase Pin-like site-specific DNA recombinase
MTYDGYVRISRVGGREGESFLSPDIQRDSIARQAKAKGIEIGEIVQERDVSGGKAIAQRELGRLVAKIERGESAGLVVWKVSRFSRNQLDGIQTAARIRDAGGHIIGEDLDTSAPMGRAMLGFLLGWGEEEKDQRRAGWNEAQGRAVARGVHVASRTPTGYRKREDGRLEPDPKAVTVIRELFARRARGEGWTTLARFLDQSGVRGSYGNKTWTPSAVAKMIANPVYLGQARSGIHVNDSAHDPLVTRAEWEAAQDVNGRPSSTPRNGEGLLLAGLIRCAGCRCVMKPDSMKDRDGSRLGLYRCRGRSAAGECPAPTSILARVIDPYIETTFLEALGPAGPLAEASASTDAFDVASRRVQETERELDDYIAANLVSVVGQERFLAGLELRQDELERAKAELREARQATAFADALELTGSLEGDWPTLSVPERRHLLTAAVDAVMVRAVRGTGRAVPVEDRVLVLWRGQGPDDLPRRGRRVPLASFSWDESPAHVTVARS